MTELMEKILSRENMMQAYKKVKAKNGASGVDGIGTEEIREYLIEKQHRITGANLSKNLGHFQIRLTSKCARGRTSQIVKMILLFGI